MNTTLAGMALCAGTLMASHAMAATTAAPTATSDKSGIQVQMHAVSESGTGDSLGTVAITQTQYGLVFTPSLKGLAPGVHGFHVHDKASCDTSEQDGKKTPAGAAGGHYDPQKTAKHGLPWGDGHLGDLPALYVDESGQASMPVLAPRLKELSQISNHALMIHKGGDNHSDHPSPLGGGGARVACGIIK